ncbi:MAG: response regulator transcription factor [Planctomycetes bacterium]|nr:response regulator transcription factor [Planctomycetota bacterium]
MSNASILLVEDEAAARELLARGLSRLGFRVTGVGDGADAVPLLHRPWDVVVTDLQMPRLDGLRLLDEVNRLCPRALRVVITSFADKDKVVAVLNLGADYLLEKPFGVDRLAGILDRLLADRSGSTDSMVQFFQRRLLGLPLTVRERDLVAGLLKGQSNKELAANLGIGEQSVKNALSAIYAKLGVQSRTELFHAVFPI